MYYNLKNQRKDGEDIYKMCAGFLNIPVPCSLLYSRMHSKTVVLFPLTLLVFILFSQTISLINWVRVRKRTLKESFLSENKDLVLSSMLFNAPDFTINNKFDMVNLMNASHNLIFIQVKENDLEKKLKERTKKEWRALYIRRFFLMLLNLLMIIACATIII